MPKSPLLAPDATVQIELSAALRRGTRQKRPIDDQKGGLDRSGHFVRDHGSILGDWRFLLEAKPSRASPWLDLERPFYLYLTSPSDLLAPGGRDTKCELAELKLTSPG